MPDRDGGSALATRVDELFRTSRPSGRRWTNNEVADEIKKANPRIKVSGAYLSAIRTGKRTNPSPELLSALAGFFGVSAAYFFDPDYAERVNTQLAAIEELKQSGVRAVAMRAIGLPDQSLEIITAVLDQIRKQQGLPPVDD